MSSKTRQRFSLDPLAADISDERSPIIYWSLIALLVIGGLLLETTIFSSWTFFGATSSLGYVAVAAIAYYAGSNTAIIFGFFAGIGADLFYQTPFGVSALSMMAVGLVIGVIQTGMMRPTPALIPILAFVVSFCGNLLYIIISIIIGNEHLFSLYSLRVIFFSSIINAIVSPLIFMVVKALMGAPAWRNR